MKNYLVIFLSKCANEIPFIKRVRYLSTDVWSFFGWKMEIRYDSRRSRFTIIFADIYIYIYIWETTRLTKTLHQFRLFFFFFPGNNSHSFQFHRTAICSWNFAKTSEEFNVFHDKKKKKKILVPNLFSYATMELIIVIIIIIISI